MARRPGVTGHRGVRRRPHGRYGAEIWDPLIRRQVWLGTFESVRDAATAYTAAIPWFYGSQEAPNFPHFSINQHGASTIMGESSGRVASPPIHHPPPPPQQRLAHVLPNRVRIILATLPPNVQNGLVSEIARRTHGVNCFRVSGSLAAQSRFNTTSNINVDEPPRQSTRNPLNFDLNLPPPEDL